MAIFLGLLALLMGCGYIIIGIATNNLRVSVAAASILIFAGVFYGVYFWREVHTSGG